MVSYTIPCYYADAQGTLVDQTLFNVLCSTVSGSGALASYTWTPITPNQPFRRTSCVDVALNQMEINPVRLDPNIANGIAATYQLFFPGKKAVDIPTPQQTWPE